MQYFGSGLDLFINKLRAAIDDRISEFEKHMARKLVEDPCMSLVKSKKQWMYEYKIWTIQNNTNKKLEIEILKYLSEGEE